MNKSIVLAESYFESYDRLNKQARKITRMSLKQFVSDERGNGFQVHDLKRTRCDKSFRSARINDDLRMIFSHQGNQFIILYVDRHDDAYNWAEGKFLNTNSFGALYLHNDSVDVRHYMEDDTLNLSFGEFDKQPSLLELQQISVKDLVKLGILEVHAEYLLEINNENKFMEFISLFPQEIQEALIDLVTGSKSLTQVYAELEDLETQNGDLATIEKSLSHKDSKRRFYTVEDIDEIDFILDEELERWKIFLHPKQQSVIKKNFRGPVIIEGGPGTGKSVVGIHRAVYLAQHIYPKNKGHRILLCTYSKKLASYIEEKVIQLMKQKNVENNVYVAGVDRLINQLVYHYKLSKGQVKIEEIDHVFKETYQKLNPEEQFLFYQTEYKEIIQKYQIESLQDYLRINRSGQGKALNPNQRKKVWVFFETFLNEKKRRKLIDFEDRANLVYQALKKKKIEPQFDSIIIDEAQDLSPIKLKALALLCRQKENNLMILSDQNQRIYNLTSWRKDININVVGRTFHLSLNYRTTKQIREYADRQFFHSSLISEHIRDYKSLFMGPEPIIQSFSNSEKQYDFLGKKINELIEEGLKPHEICVMSPIDQMKITMSLKKQQIPVTSLQKDIYPKEGNGIGVSTLHGSKGLEFRTVILTNYTDIGKSIDREKLDDWYVLNEIKQVECLKYVASTRAREELIVTFVE